MAVSLDTSCKTLTCAMVSSICLDKELRGDGEGRVFNWRVLRKNQEDGPESILNKTLGRAQDPRANGAWLSKLTE